MCSEILLQNAAEEKICYILSSYHIIWRYKLKLAEAKREKTKKNENDLPPIIFGIYVTEHTSINKHSLAFIFALSA